MRSVGGVVLAPSVTSMCLGVAHSAFAASDSRGERKHARVNIDGRLRPGHLESIRVVGFPGKGVTEVSLFPTAICEDACGARSFRGRRTDVASANPEPVIVRVGASNRG